MNDNSKALQSTEAIASIIMRLRTEMKEHFTEGLAVITSDELDLIEAALAESGRPALRDDRGGEE